MTRPVIAHTTDLSGEDAPAFLHACALAAASHARLVTVHGNAPDLDGRDLPDAAVLADRWARPIDHDRMCHECCDDVTDTVLDAIRQIGPALVVTGTHARHGLAALLHASVSEAIARNIDVPTLFVQNQGTGFVDPATGEIQLRRVLVPAGTRDEALAGITAARLLVALVGLAAPELVVVHATRDGDPLDLTDLPVPVIHHRGTLEDVIVAAAAERRAGLIVMGSRGHDGVLDTLRGSHTERVMRDVGCPVLAVPIRGLT